MAGIKKALKSVGGGFATCGKFIGRNAAKGGKFIGRHSAKCGVFIGKKTAEGWRAIDPDVKRHIAQLPLLSYSLFVSKNEAIEPGEPDGHAPLIFVHGMGGNRGNFLLMAFYLRHRGRRRSYKIHFAPGQTMDEMAIALANFIRKVKKVTGKKQVEIVTHSLGGIIARLAINDHRIGPSVKSLIALAAPFNGTYPARYANTVNIRDLRPNSAFIKKLNSKPLPAHIRTVTFWSKNDLFVLPPESAIIEGAESVDMTPFTHYQYLFDPRCWGAVATTLGCR